MRGCEVVATCVVEQYRQNVVRAAAREAREFPWPPTVEEDLARQRGEYLLRLRRTVDQLMAKASA